MFSCSRIETEKPQAQALMRRISVTVAGEYWATFFAYAWNFIKEDEGKRRVLTLYDGEIMPGVDLQSGPLPYSVTFPAGVRIDAEMKVEKIHRIGQDVQWVTFGFIADEVMVDPVSYVGTL